MMANLLELDDVELLDIDPEDQEAEPIHFSTTKRGRPKLIKGGFAYVQDKRGSENIPYWRCEKWDEMKCKGRLKTDGDVVISES